MKIETRRDRGHKGEAEHVKEMPAKKSRAIERWALYIVSFALLAVVGTLFQEVLYGQILIIIYGIVSLFTKIQSKETFKMAIISVFCIILLLLIGNEEMAKSFAIYSYLLLCFGAIKVNIEYLRRPERKGGL